jgi:hypothetical protein
MLKQKVGILHPGMMGIYVAESIGRASMIQRIW